MECTSSFFFFVMYPCFQGQIQDVISGVGVCEGQIQDVISRVGCL